MLHRLGQFPRPPRATITVGEASGRTPCCGPYSKRRLRGSGYPTAKSHRSLSDSARSTPRPRARCARASRPSGISSRRSSGPEWTEGIVLRYGAFYGPRTPLAPGGELFELVRKRKLPLIGDGGGVWSFIHIADAAEATAAAIERGSRGVYNVVDDDPAPVAEWLPALAQELDAKKPMRVPRFVGRLFAGEAGVVMMTDAAARRTRRPGASWPGARNTQAGGRGSQRHDRSRATARRAAAGRLRDRLPDARQRLRGRGRRAGSPAAGASGA